MAKDPILTQEEIDRMFSSGRSSGIAATAETYDFRRADRMPREQLRSIRLLYENFARAFAASLSAYLRAYVTVTLISLEQLSYREFSRSLASPTVLMVLEMAPYEGHALLEISPGLAFPILEIAMGGTTKTLAIPDREITEIEADILQGVTRVLLNDLKRAWSAITEIDFRVVRYETEPQLVQFLSHSEAVVAVTMETRIAEQVGTINIAVPSLIIKMFRQKFAERSSLSHRGTLEDEQRMFRLLQPAQMLLDACLEAGSVRLGEILALEPGNVIRFDYPLERPAKLKVNGLPKYDGWVVESRGKRAFRIE